jgi:hypothetical protein
MLGIPSLPSCLIALGVAASILPGVIHGQSLAAKSGTFEEFTKVTVETSKRGDLQGFERTTVGVGSRQRRILNLPTPNRNCRTNRTQDRAAYHQI